jgi:phage-related baseplate assembly protein
MANSVRGYPEIEFVDTDTKTLVNDLIASYEMFTGRTLYPADPVRLFILWIADIIIQERVNIDFSAKQNLPRYAEGEYLDSLAEIFKDAYRMEPEKAKTTLKFTLSMPLTGSTTIPAGTRTTVDGEIIFQTTAALTIPAGSVSGEVAAECTETGETGNGFVPGQISQLIDIFPYYESVENTTESGGGAEEESDEAFYDRMRESMETFSTAGPLGAYEYYAKSASALIVDAKATSTAPGVADIRILLKGGGLPGEEVINKVKAVLTDDKVRPMTDQVIVSAPETIETTVDITFFVPKPSAASASVVESAVQQAVETYKEWQSAKMGRDINPSYLISLLMQTGAKRVEIRNPLYLAVPENSVAVITGTNIVNGGVEDE